MQTFNQNKKCEQCDKQVPDDYVNLLCWECYEKVTAENERLNKERAEQEKAELLKKPEAPTHPDNIQTIQPAEDIASRNITISKDFKVSRFGITDPDYQENPEADDKDQILANLAQFIYSHNPDKKRAGKLLWYPQRNMYTFIKNWCMKQAQSHPQYPKQIWKPYVVDVGCGSGVGTNVLSQEAHFTWGIDKNVWSIEFAKEAFTRERNNYYYSGQLTFDVFDVLEDNRETLKFDVVVAIEVIEHIYDTDAFLKGIIRFTKKNKQGSPQVPFPTTFFLSSPNRNFHKIRKDRPENTFHVREWTSQELVSLLRQYFSEVQLLNQKGEPISEDTQADEVVLAKCIYPK